MKTVELGRTRLHVSPLCIGTAALGNMPEAFGFPVSRQQAERTVEYAFRNPSINYMDASRNYGNAEKIIGQVMKDLGGLPQGFVLQTKVDRDENTGDFSGDQVKRSFEKSLEALGVPTIQVVFIHDPEHAPFEAIMVRGGALDVLRQYQQQGLIGHIGISGGPIGMLKQYVETGEFVAVITHSRFNLVNRTAEPLLNLAQERGVAVLNASPFASGILTDTNNNRFVYEEASQDIIKRVEQIKHICKKYGTTLREAALQFSVRDPRITATIVGPTTPEQVEDCIALLTHPVPNEFFNEINKYALFSGDPEAGRFSTRLYSD